MLDIQSLFIPVVQAQEAAQSTSPVEVLGLNFKLFIAQQRIDTVRLPR